jgi:lipoic acid synthetase
LRVAPRTGDEYFRLRALMRDEGLNTICTEGRCPNTSECWNQGTATFMILGDQCTRRCTFCNVGYGWSGTVDADEPERLARAIGRLGLSHVVITSVDRDDLPDGGAGLFVESVRQIRSTSPDCGIELLIPDFAGKEGALERVLGSRPDVLAHNLETVPRLYAGVRPRSQYARSLDLLRRVAASSKVALSKTGIMVGLGETHDELVHLMAEVAAAGVDIFTVGQYLQPSVKHHRVERFYAPGEFEALADRGRALGLVWVEAGPLVRSSYHAANQTQALG